MKSFKEFISHKETPRRKMIDEFVQFAKNKLGIQELPTFEFDHDVSSAKSKRTMATYNPSDKHIWCYENNRNMADLLRSIAHELTHHKQNEDGRLYAGAGETGTDIENEANSMAGVMLREYGQLNSEIYESTNT